MPLDEFVTWLLILLALLVFVVLFISIRDVVRLLVEGYEVLDNFAILKELSH